MSLHSFYFNGDPYLSVLKGMYDALNSAEPLIKFIGAPGTGKTRLCEKLTQFMRKKGHQVHFFEQAFASPEELRYVLSETLQLPESQNLARTLEQRLAASAESTEGRVTLIFDKADKFTITTLLDIYRFAEIQSGSQRLLNIVLCGNNGLDQRLHSSPEFQSLLQQITHNFHLLAMTKELLNQFYLSFFAEVDMQGLQLSSDALNLAYRVSRGLPSIAADIAKAIGESRIGATEFPPVSKQEVAGFIEAHNLGDSGSLTQVLPSPNQRRLYAPVFVVLAVVSVAYLFQQDSSDDPAANQDNDVEVLRESLNRDEDGQLQSNSPFVAEEETQNTVSSRQVAPPITTRSGEDITNVAANSSGTVAETQAERDLEPTSQASPELQDSGLALVTAVERGISADQLVSPVFEDLESLANAIERAEAVGLSNSAAQAEQQIATPIDDTAPAPTAMAMVDELVSSPPSSAADDVAEPLISDTDISTSVASANSSPPISESRDENTINPAAAEAATTEELSADALNESQASRVKTPRDFIDDWVAAWQDQDVEAYLNAYHPQFIPRYQDSVSSWRRLRERNINRPDWIRLGLSELEVVAESAERIEVTFWLAYEASNYQDDTQKRLVLLEADGRWLIQEEVNLAVR